MFRVLPQRPASRTESRGIPTPRHRSSIAPSFPTVENTHLLRMLLLMRNRFNPDGDGTVVNGPFSAPEQRMMTFLHYPTLRSGDAIRGTDDHLVVRLHRIIPLTTSRMLVITRDLAGNEYQDEYAFRIPPRLPGWYYRLLGATLPVA